MSKRTKSIRSECERVSRKVEKGTCFRELSSKARLLSSIYEKQQHLESQMKTIWMCDMAYLQQKNLKKKRLEHRTNYRQLAFDIR